MSPARTSDIEHLPPDLAELLNRLAMELEKLYAERYSDLVLYGSYARGEADEGSDVDVLLLLRGEVDATRELLHAAQAKWALALDAGYTVSLLPVSVEAYLDSEQPFLRNARSEGIPLS